MNIFQKNIILIFKEQFHKGKDLVMIKTIFLIVLGLIFFCFIVVIFLYNQFIRLKSLLDEALSGIDVQLKRRYDLVSQLLEVVKGYPNHEKTIFQDIAKMRAASLGTLTVEEATKADVGLTGALKTLFAVAENYPGLKANEQFTSLQKEISVLENDIQLARRYYNATARNYDIAVDSFPSNIIARLNGYTKVTFFQLTKGDEHTQRNIPF